MLLTTLQSQRKGGGWPCTSGYRSAGKSGGPLLRAPGWKGFEPLRAALEAAMLPLHHHPKSPRRRVRVAARESLSFAFARRLPFGRSRNRASTLRIARPSGGPADRLGGPDGTRSSLCRPGQGRLRLGSKVDIRGVYVVPCPSPMVARVGASGSGRSRTRTCGTSHHRSTAELPNRSGPDGIRTRDLLGDNQTAIPGWPTRPCRIVFY